jgi:hypothetical protein
LISITASFEYDWHGAATVVEIASAAIEGTEYSTSRNPSLSRRGKRRLIVVGQPPIAALSNLLLEFAAVANGRYL